MNQADLLYAYPSITIAVVLFVAIVAMNEIAYRLGEFVQSRTDDEVKSLTGAIQGSILGLLALLLGFTFSMSMDRYNNRSMALIDEANAIGTAVLRVQLLPEQYQDQATELIDKYLDVRVAVGSVALTKHREREAYIQQTHALQNELWRLAVAATEDDPRPVTTGAFVKSLNDMIDAQGKRNALLDMQVPEIVLLLLFVVFIASGAMMGYSAGLSGKRVLTPILLVSVLITLIVFIIIDLDRPKRGLIQVNQTVMQQLADSLGPTNKGG